MYYNDYNSFQQEPVELQPILPPEPPKKKKGRGLRLAALCLRTLAACIFQVAKQFLDTA